VIHGQCCQEKKEEDQQAQVQEAPEGQSSQEAVTLQGIPVDGHGDSSMLHPA
jgi:hypothetical protein